MDSLSEPLRPKYAISRIDKAMDLCLTLLKERFSHLTFKKEILRQIPSAVIGKTIDQSCTLETNK